MKRFLIAVLLAGCGDAFVAADLDVAAQIGTGQDAETAPDADVVDAAVDTMVPIDARIQDSATDKADTMGQDAYGCSSPFPLCCNRLRSPGETDVDCGGSQCAACGLGRWCLVGSDCQSGRCADVGNGGPQCQP